MSRTRIKFCGITRAQDALAAVALGVDALGFVLVPKSKRWIAPEKAALIRSRLPPFVAAVALFQNADAAAVQLAVDVLRPDLLQFHGEEDAGFCESFGLPYLKSVAMGTPQNLTRVAARYASATALLLDGHAEGELGGSGKSFDLSRLQIIKKPLVLAGGLTPQNVGAALKKLRAHAVDVSTGIESKPGIKDPEKMRAFVLAVNKATGNSLGPGMLPAAFLGGLTIGLTTG